MHKENVKKPAKRTQRRTDVFDKQSAKIISEKVVAKRAINKFGNKQTNYNQVKDNSSLTTYGYRFGKFNRETVFSLLAHWHNTQFSQETITNWMKEKVCPYTSHDVIKCFTEVKMDNNIYRANPCYYLGAQHEWALVHWGGVNQGMCQLS